MDSGWRNGNARRRANSKNVIEGNIGLTFDLNCGFIFIKSCCRLAANQVHDFSQSEPSAEHILGG